MRLAGCAFAIALWTSSCLASAHAAGAGRNDYANPRFMSPFASGLNHFYRREFAAAQADFAVAVGVVPDNTLAISFLDAAASHRDGSLEALTNGAEDAVSATPKDYVAHVRLGFAYLFEGLVGRDRAQDARDEFNAAVALDNGAPAARVGLGIMRANERSSNRAKTELLAALRANPSDVLAREYLGQLYQTDLHDPARGLAYMIDVPNLVPQYADIAFHIGSVLFDLHQPEAAIRYLERGLELDVGRVGEAGQHGDTLLRADLPRCASAGRCHESARCGGCVGRGYHLRQDVAREDP